MQESAVTDSWGVGAGGLDLSQLSPAPSSCRSSSWNMRAWTAVLAPAQRPITNTWSLSCQALGLRSGSPDTARELRGRGSWHTTCPAPRAGF